MNYRHSFHAGNFADVLKHVLLAHCLSYLIAKPAPIRFIDTHAGTGWYDLDGTDARRTGEWRTGIAQLRPEAVPTALQPLFEPYFAAVGPFDPERRPLLYPGSPAIAQHLLRPADVLLLSELHPVDHGALRQALGHDKRVKSLEQDGFRTLKAAIPPPERRGLILIDPPFEVGDDFDRMVEAVATLQRKWPTGTALLWYPIKDTAAVAQFRRSLEAFALPNWLDLTIGHDGSQPDGRGLKACGMFLINPPWTLHAQAAPLLRFLASSFDTAGTARWRGDVDGRST